MSEAGKVIEFYDEICRDIADDNIKTLIEGFVEFKNPTWGKVCKWVDVADGALENVENFETVLTASKRYSEAKTQEFKNKVVAENLSATLKAMSFVTSIFDITNGFSKMFGIAAKCLDEGLRIVNQRVNDLEAYYEAIEGCSVTGDYGELRNKRDKISGAESDMASAQELLSHLNNIISVANRLTGSMKIDTSEVSKKISVMSSKVQSLTQTKYNIINNLNNKTGEQFMSLADIEKSDLGEISEKTNGAEKTKADPLILDLSGDGFNIEKKKNGTYFDLNCNGFAERINWTRSDAILSIDKNNNGKIDDGSEVFGDYHLLADGTRAKNGFEALAQYDSNGDGIIDANDEIFDQLKLWVDADGDGISAEGELKTLKELHIKAIHLDYEYVNETTETEALIGNVAKFEYEDGTKANIGEMWVSSDLYDAIEAVTVSMPDAVEGLPNVRSYGTVRSLHSAIATDETGELLSLVRSFSEETDNNEKIKITEAILCMLCDTESVAEGSRGKYVDAKKMKVIESFMGESFMGVNGANPNSAAAPILNRVYDDLVKMYCFAMIGSGVKEHFDKLHAVEDADGNIVPDVDFFNIYLYTAMELGQIDDKTFADICLYLGYYCLNVKNDYVMFNKVRTYFEMTDKKYVGLMDETLYGTIRGAGGANVINGTTLSDVIYGGDGNDAIHAGAGDDIVCGGAGADTIYGGSGNDTLIGRTGNDRLEGGNGNDTYIFNVGDGVDIINEYECSTTEGRQDRIVFGEGISADSVDIQRSGDDLVIKYGEGDVITVKSAYYYSDGRYMVENIEFADGTKLDISKIAVTANHLYGTEGNDVINGYRWSTGYNESETIHAGGGNDTINGGNGNDTLYGEEGNDAVYGGYGDDTIIGGKGNDTLNGENGNDTYVFNKGDGADIINEYECSTTEGRQDRIVFGEGISADSVNIQRSGDDLVIKYGEGDVITVKSAYYYSDGRYMVENIEFADGTKLDVNKIAVTANHLYGTEGNDVINGYRWSTGYNESETIHAGGGNDTVNGGNGNDTLYGEAGADILNGGNGDDTLNGGTGNDRLEGGYGNDTYVFNKGDGVDIINEYECSTTEGRQDRIVFGEGISADSVDVQRSGNNLVIRYGEGDVITVENAYSYSDGRYMVENIEFSDGTKWQYSDIQKLVSLKSAGKNIVKGSAGDEQYTYDFDSKDINIYDVGGEDTITLGANLLDMIFERSGNDLCIAKNTEDSGRRTLTINNWYAADKYQIENICTSDGYSITNSQVQLLIEDMAAFVSDYGISEGVKIVETSNNTLQADQLFASKDMQ